MTGKARSNGWWAGPALAMVVSLLAASPAAAVTVTVPGDYATIQEAVDAVQSDGVPGEVIVESDGVFDETVVILESVTLRAGEGFSPTIERTGTSFGPLRIIGDPDDETEVSVSGLTLRLIDADAAAAVSIRNASATERLDVGLGGVTVEVENSGFAVRAESSDGGDVVLAMFESSVEIVGATIGNPACVRLGGSGFDLEATIAANRFRFSNAQGLHLIGGADADERNYFVLANVFESFQSPVGTARDGVEVEGLGNTMGNLSSAQVLLLSNLFVGNLRAIHGLAARENEIELVATNNTIVDSSFGGIELQAGQDSTMTVGLANNIVVGTEVSEDGSSGGFGVLTRVLDQAVIDLVNGHNLLFDNVSGDYSGSAMPGPGDVFADPRFAAPGQGDYRLSAASPAIEAGDNEPPPLGDVGDVDLEIGPRILDGDLDGTTIVDIGAYERPAPSSAVEVPTLSPLGLLAFVALLGTAAAWRLRRRQARAAPGS